MTVSVKAWVEERQAIRSYTTEDWQHYRHEDGGNFWAGRGRSDFHLTVDDAAFCVDAHKNLPRALNALEQVLELIEFMETDAENYLNAGHIHASEVLLENAGDLRQAIEGAING